ncbi:hypothetical protein K432DRAFT_284596, partial [Lepidopterella palustris CBS 459.81]
VVITIINDTLGNIHTVTLRWALYRENRLEFNSNLRLFSSTKSIWNSWYVNLFILVCVIATYASSPFLLLGDNS